MKKIVFLFFFVVSASYSQNDSKFLISLENSNNTQIEGDFYINKIYDGRQVKSNIGTVQRSLFNTKVLADFKKPFVEELSDFLNVCYPKVDNKKAIDIRIDELYVSEVTQSNKETGYANVVLDIIENRNGQDIIVGNFSSTVEGTGMDVTSKHGQRLIEAINNCFRFYKESNDADKINIIFDPEKKIGDVMPIDIKEGVYVNYMDLFEGKSLNLEAFTVTNYDGRKCLLNNKTGKLENSFYGFNDGQSFYINLFRFSTLKLYAKTEIMGSNYFIDSVKTNSMDLAAITTLYGGIIGSVPLLFPDLSEIEVPLLLDRISGTPVLLTNKYLINLLSTNKELLKDYRKTGRTSADKKVFYKKYYNF